MRPFLHVKRKTVTFYNEQIVILLFFIPLFQQDNINTKRKRLFRQANYCPSVV